MYTNNPYAQAGWSNPQNPHSINERPSLNAILAACPPTYGALPPYQVDVKENINLTFQFLCADDALNCIIIGPNSKKLFEVRTTQNVTRVIDESNDVFGNIRWSSHPTLEVRGILSERQTRDFLRLSSDKRFRTMIIQGKSYVWIPVKNGTILHREDLRSPEPMARIAYHTTKQGQQIILELVTEAVQQGLLQPCIMATILLSTSRFLD
uniref:Uncharacterized protein n=1 Tax=Psilocybe cubensis TaxID=181762 RepID=A0A8H7XQT3_PSICU